MPDATFYWSNEPLDTVGDFLDFIEKNSIPREATFFDTGYETEGRYDFHVTLKVEGPEPKRVEVKRPKKTGYVTFEVRTNRA